ncbi:hypothetical protein SCAR479_04943 [Seiridium cardinale]|uniref:Myb-like domain-containing protein n=1 Tax=Seiridium cardinale TaxID=138064 RepID=A0ABR2Y4V7_9PEZI
MNKNWGDRADKDLFFTILSVKNIGVISGAEWTTIGNHMRTLGYGFTNEGCRQHFQGLRRAQHKAESNGSGSEGPKKGDPTMNPITRRPGPGRGRPKKQPPTASSQLGQDEDAADAEVVAALSEQLHQAPSAPLPVDAHMSGDLPVPMTLPTQDPASLGLVAAEDDLEEQPAKRQRLDDPTDHLEDTAGLALDDGNVDSMVHHDLPEYFGEA